MKWVKKGRIFAPDGSSEWKNNSALVPTPLILDDKTIRIYTGIRDRLGASRIGWVDVDANDPSRIINVSSNPVLDIGKPGCFDDNGVSPCCVVRNGDKIFLYYSGYQIPSKVKFLVFSGLAISHDNGNTFVRHSDVPITDRTAREPYFRVIHSLIKKDEVWHAWYGGGDSWLNETRPVYDIRHTTSLDGITFSTAYNTCVAPSSDEYRVARPWVIWHESKYRMFFGAGAINPAYRLAYAESDDGITWSRDDSRLQGLQLSNEGWDSNMMGYPSVVMCNGRVFLFYNGNDMGKAGFGYAELQGW